MLIEILDYTSLLRYENIGDEIIIIVYLWFGHDLCFTNVRPSVHSMVGA